jgi:hypothetical protein
VAAETVSTLKPSSEHSGHRSLSNCLSMWGGIASSASPITKLITLDQPETTCIINGYSARIKVTAAGDVEFARTFVTSRPQPKRNSICVSISVYSSTARSRPQTLKRVSKTWPSSQQHHLSGLTTFRFQGSKTGDRCSLSL